MKIEAIVIGSSAGGMHALKTLLSGIPSAFQLPILIVQHLNPHTDSYLATFLNQNCDLTVKEAEPGEKILHGTVYLAPPNMHLLVEDNHTLSLSTDEKVNYSRPSIDVLFETAARVYQKKLIGIILTGANHDGAYGMAMIHSCGGLTLAENPATAEVPVMPEAAIKTGGVQHILPLDLIAPFILQNTSDYL